MSNITTSTTSGAADKTATPESTEKNAEPNVEVQSAAISKEFPAASGEDWSTPDTSNVQEVEERVDRKSVV